jgi:hypothetical protein
MARITAVTGLVATVVALIVAGGASAATGLSSTYAVSGIETSFPTNNTSTFGGAALGSGGDAATWRASVQHQSLSNCPFGSNTSCAITGGTFSLSSFDGARLTGAFVPNQGTVTPISQQAGCGKQVFAVSGALSTSAGPAVFAAKLTHYRISLFGTCIPYFATITNGSLHLT